MRMRVRFIHIHGGTQPYGNETSPPSVDANPTVDQGPVMGRSNGVVDENAEIEMEQSVGPESSISPPVELATDATPTTPTFSNILTPTPKPADIHFSQVWEVDWGHEYEKCPRWGPVYRAVQGATADWPKDVKVLNGKIYLKELLCIPWSLQEPIVREFHTFLGHVGFERLWKAMSLKYTWSEIKSAVKFAKGVMGQCESCQACQRPGDLHGILEPTPVPPTVMVSVAMDLFDMPPVDYEGALYNIMVV